MTMSKKFDEQEQHIADLLHDDELRREAWKTYSLERVIKSFPPDQRKAAFELALARLAEEEAYMPLLVKARKMPIEELKKRLAD